MNPEVDPHTRRRAGHVAPGAVAALAAGGLGASVWAVFLALLLYLLAFMPRRRDALVALLGAPALLAVGSPLETLLVWRTLAWLLILVAATTPLFLVLGGRVPWRALPGVAGAILLLTALILVGAWTPSFGDADIATRAQVVLLAAATLLVMALAPLFERTATTRDGDEAPAPQGDATRSRSAEGRSSSGISRGRFWAR